ncbi:MAG: hypothetical protein ACR2MW_09380 [Chthoniobacterales bacterium]
MSTRTTIFFFLAGACLGLTNARAEEVIPQPQKFSRYEPMLRHSPFAVATAGAPVGATPDFARELYVANAGHSNDGDFVTVASTTNRDLKLYLTTKQAVDGYAVPNILWSDRVGETKVTITKDGQVATLSFNEAVLSQAIQNPVPQVVRPANGMVPNAGTNLNPGMPMAIPRPMTVPTIPTPPPYTRPLIRRGGVKGDALRRRLPTNQEDDEPAP